VLGAARAKWRAPEDPLVDSGEPANNPDTLNLVDENADGKAVGQPIVL